MGSGRETTQVGPPWVGGINDSDRVPLLICVKSKHGCSSGMIGWTANPLNPYDKLLFGGVLRTLTTK